MVKAFWIKKYKAHTKYACNQVDQVGNNNYKSAAVAYTQPPSGVTSGMNVYNTYISALEDVIAWQMVEREDVLAVTTRVTSTPNPTATPNPTVTDLMANIKKEMATLIVAAMAAEALANGSGSGISGGSSGSGRQHKTAYGKDKNGNDLPKCPHCNKLATHKPNDCFSLPNNAEKMKTANFINGKCVKKAA